MPASFLVSVKISADVMAEEDHALGRWLAAVGVDLVELSEITDARAASDPEKCRELRAARADGRCRRRGREVQKTANGMFGARNLGNSEATEVAFRACACGS